MKKLCARALMVSLPLLVTLHSVPASAQNVAAADALFTKGEEEMAKGNYKEACPAFRESYKLDPVPGALHALAVCHARAGQVASAVVRFDEYLRIYETLPPNQKAKHAARAKEAKEQRTALAPEVPELTLVLPAGAPPGTRVFQDSIELSTVSLGIGLPIDPGTYVVTTQAPGGPVKEHPITIKKADKVRLELTVLAPTPPPPKTQDAGQGKVVSRPGPSAGKEPSIGPTAESATGEAGTGMSGYRIGAFVAGGIGAAALLGGIVTGVMVLGKKSIIEENCNDTKCSSGGVEQAREAAESAQVLGAISTAGFVVGVAGLAGGAVLFSFEPGEKSLEGRRRQRMGSIGIGFTSARPLEWTAGIKGAW